MNKLSWFLYCVDIIGNLRVLNGLYLGVTPFVFAVLAVVIGVANEDYSDDETKTARWKRLRKAAMWMGSVYGIAILLAIVVPSQRTMYLIAGSEAAETVANSAEGQEILSAVRAKIREYLQTETSK